LKWPGATNDITAYKQTELYHAYLKGDIPKWATFVLDEAYSSIGDRHLCPYSIHQLKAAAKISEEKLFKCRAFNNMLSSQRITIERVFGMLFRCFGILSRRLDYELANIILIINVCVKLHNLRIDVWVAANRPGSETGPEPPPQTQDYDQMFENGASQRDTVADDQPLNSANMERIANQFVENVPRAKNCVLRNSICQHIFDCGIRWHSSTFNDFLTPFDV